MTQEIIQTALQALAGNNPEHITAVFTEDAEWLSPPGNAVATALATTSHMVGREAIVRFFAQDFPRLFARDLAVAIHGIHVDGPRAVVEATLAATLGNGNHYDNDYCFVFELQDGLVHRVREYVDTARGHRMVFGAETEQKPPLRL